LTPEFLVRLFSAHSDGSDFTEAIQFSEAVGTVSFSFFPFSGKQKAYLFFFTYLSGISDRKKKSLIRKARIRIGFYSALKTTLYE